jgi:hypothetical protein
MEAGILAARMIVAVEAVAEVELDEHQKRLKCCYCR